jgi:hypothetical protein
VLPVISTSDVAFAITTMSSREEYWRRCVRGIRSTFLDVVPIYMVNQSRASAIRDGVAGRLDDGTWEYALGDIGLSACRNFLARRVSYNFLVLLDDDIIIDGRFRLWSMLQLMGQHSIDALAPKLLSPDGSWPRSIRWFGTLHLDDGVVKRDRRGHPWRAGGVTGTEVLPPGAIVVRRAALNHVPFDERLKQCEGLEWCWRARKELRMGFWLDSVAVHAPGGSARYLKMRDRERKKCNDLAKKIMDIRATGKTTSMLGMWKKTYQKGRKPASRLFGGGHHETAWRAAKFFNRPEVQLVEDWGCGFCGFKDYITEHQRYRGIDGSSPHADVLTDLVRYKSDDADAILIRHVLEHNPDWRIILQNAVESTRRLLVLVLFTPFDLKKTRVIRKYPNWQGTKRAMVDQSFLKSDITDCFEGLRWSLDEGVETKSQYKVEHVFCVEKETKD